MDVHVRRGELAIGTTVIDEPNDGIIDEIQLFGYDAEGRLLYREIDLLADSYPDAIDWYVYDQVTGLLVEHDSEDYEPPPDQDDVFTLHFEYQYDEQLRRVEQWSEGSDTTDGDTVEFTSLSTWTFAGTCP